MPRKKTIDRSPIDPKPRPKPVARLVKLWRTLTPEMHERVAVLMKSSTNNLRQYVFGRRNISPEVAIKFEKATYELGLEPVNRMQLSPTCRNCEYALKVNPKGTAE